MMEKGFYLEDQFMGASLVILPPNLGKILYLHSEEALEHADRVKMQTHLHNV
jgi:hypothetical protein